MKPWKSLLPRLSPRFRTSFNGATAMKPWKSKSDAAPWNMPTRFNGATAMKPWKRPVERGTLCVRFKLQWGHGDEAVEEAGPV